VSAGGVIGGSEGWTAITIKTSATWTEISEQNAGIIYLRGRNKAFQGISSQRECGGSLTEVRVYGRGLRNLAHFREGWGLYRLVRGEGT